MTPTTKAGRALLDTDERKHLLARLLRAGVDPTDWRIVTDFMARADEADALRAALEGLATKWADEAHLLLLVRGYSENIKGWALEECIAAIAALATPAAPVAASERCGFPEGCQAEATCELSINGTTWHLCDDHAVRVLEAFAPAAPAEDA